MAKQVMDFSCSGCDVKWRELWNAGEPFDCPECGTRLYTAPGARQMVYIVAGNYQQARLWAKEHHCPKEGFKYVWDPSVLEGAQGHVVFCGTWTRHPRVWEIRDMVEVLVLHKSLSVIEE